MVFRKNNKKKDDSEPSNSDERYAVNDQANGVEIFKGIFGNDNGNDGTEPNNGNADDPRKEHTYTVLGPSGDVGDQFKVDVNSLKRPPLTEEQLLELERKNKEVESMINDQARAFFTNQLKQLERKKDALTSEEFNKEMNEIVGRTMKYSLDLQVAYGNSRAFQLTKAVYDHLYDLKNNGFYPNISIVIGLGALIDVAIRSLSKEQIVFSVFYLNKLNTALIEHLGELDFSQEEINELREMLFKCGVDGGHKDNEAVH